MASAFKQQCLAVLDQVERDHVPVVVTGGARDQGRPHPPVRGGGGRHAHRLVTERWRWVWLAEDGTDAGHLGMAFLGDRVEVTASLARPGHDLVVLHEPDAPLPRTGSREIRASGLWADAIEEERGQRWTIGLEAFALAVDHPEDTLGVRVPLGFDLEWERSGPDTDGRTPARVHGEVLIEADALDLDAIGWWRCRSAEGAADTVPPDPLGAPPSSSTGRPPGS